jgi:hypothetical protein
MQKQSPFLVIIILLLLSCFQGISQTKSTVLSEQETKSLLCHKWRVVSLTVSGEKIPMEKDDIYVIAFFTDGRFLDSQEGEEKWTYNHATRTITTGNVPKKIIRITDTELVLRSKHKEGVAVLTLKRDE